jgi:hypothetical protein
MGLIIFIFLAVGIAIAVSTYIVVRGRSIPPYQEPLNPNANWPFPTDNKP